MTTPAPNVLRTAHPRVTARVADVMTRSLVCVTPDDTLAAAWELMSRGSFRHLPVVGGDGRVLSVVDDRGVAAALLRDWLPQRRLRVRDVMAARVRYAGLDATLDEIAAAMESGQVDCVVIVDSDDRLLGLITDRDVAAIFQELRR